MPNINLRLSDEEHEALRKWAYEGRRSIQREIIFRLFASDLPAHVKDAITEQETKLTDEVRKITGDDTVVVEYEMEPVTVSEKKNRPTAARCGMRNRHHMNSKQNPCPRCGYPA